MINNLDLINQLSGYIGWKNLELNHLGCNINLANSLKLKHPQSIIGLKDSDFLTEEEASFHWENDQLVLQGQTVQCIHFRDNSAFFLIKKELLDDNRKRIGIIYHCHLVETPYYSQLNQSDKKYCSKDFLPSHYKKQSENKFGLSKRELQCMFYILRGKKSKEIGLILNLSKRTIDFYIDNIKNKMGCQNKTELILAGLSAGYMNIVP